MSEPTLFEKIIAREIPGDFVYEDDLVVAFRDISPVAPTHILIVPRKPIVSLQHTTEEDEPILGRLLHVARKLGEQEGLDGGFRCVINSGNEGGQVVPHLHVHLIGGQKLGEKIV